MKFKEKLNSIGIMSSTPVRRRAGGLTKTEVRKLTLNLSDKCTHRLQEESVLASKKRMEIFIFKRGYRGQPERKERDVLVKFILSAMLELQKKESWKKSLSSNS
ncbi:uncharacterized protein LOC143682774 isoform X1 [Tamandua tetradactyla]|uniref:uncharacterized protein LOC143682774 isoform X1 n=1 Tax=Tamandua tetradactyla TaxID=48850 RepID=UPI0040549CA3